MNVFQHRLARDNQHQGTSYTSYNIGGKVERMGKLWAFWLYAEEKKSIVHGSISSEEVEVEEQKETEVVECY